jgi:hypothetical protein
MASDVQNKERKKYILYIKCQEQKNYIQLWPCLAQLVLVAEAAYLKSQ